MVSMAWGYPPLVSEGRDKHIAVHDVLAEGGLGCELIEGEAGPPGPMVGEAAVDFVHRLPEDPALAVFHHEDLGFGQESDAQGFPESGPLLIDGVHDGGDFGGHQRPVELEISPGLLLCASVEERGGRGFGSWGW